MNINTIHLIIDKGPESGREIHVPPQGVKVGSAPGESGICLQDKDLVTEHCCFFFREGDGLWVETIDDALLLINDHAVKRQRLYINDTVTMGGTALLVVNDERPVHLIIENGPQRGRHIGVPPGGVDLGRVPGEDGVAIQDPTVSRCQCRLYFRSGNELWIEDLGAANQTMVNHTPVTMRRLNANDHILVGSTKLQVLDDGSGAGHAKVERIAARVSEDEDDEQNEVSDAISSAAQKRSGTIVIRSGAVSGVERRNKNNWSGLVIKLIVLSALAYAALLGYRFLAGGMNSVDEPAVEVILPDLRD